MCMRYLSGTTNILSILNQLLGITYLPTMAKQKTRIETASNHGVAKIELVTNLESKDSFQNIHMYTQDRNRNKIFII